MQLGFAKTDITPRVGVELCGFGPFLGRHSIAVRDRLWARAMAVSLGDQTLILVSCDIIGVERACTARARRIVAEATGLPPEAVMVHTTHAHSGPSTYGLIGWGQPDPPYLEVLPGRIARAAVSAWEARREGRLSHAAVPCEGMGYNRQYDKRPEIEDALREDWRPAKPELTDTVCHVVKAEVEGRVAGFLSYFGCHPVVCCGSNRYIHGDYAGVATNMLEREWPGSVGLFLQGAQGDVNTCVVHHDEQTALLALDVIASRHARSVRRGMAEAKPVEVDALGCALNEVTFTRADWNAERIGAFLAEQEAVLHAPEATDADRAARMAMVYAIACRRLLGRLERGESLAPPSEVQGLRIGPLGLVASPFETFQAIKNEVVAAARAPVPLVLGVTNDSLGYAPDAETAGGEGYADRTVPFILGSLPFARIHEELPQELLRLDAALFGG